MRKGKLGYDCVSRAKARPEIKYKDENCFYAHGGEGEGEMEVAMFYSKVNVK